MTNAERQKRYRAKRNVTRTVTESPESVTPVTETVTGRTVQEDEALLRKIFGSEAASLGDYLDDHGRKYIPRTEPDKLNWGAWMSSDELSRAGLKANRVSIPGDWDYKGE